MSKIYEYLLRPVLFRSDAEMAHEIGLHTIHSVLSSRMAQEAAGSIFNLKDQQPCERFGIRFANPVGMAAGFDKNALVVDQLAALGFGFVEVGTVTPEPQPGNEKPRMFRLAADRALINRLGFNNKGAAAAVERLRNSRRKCVIGVNIGKNKHVPNEEAVEDYLKCLETVFESADYIAINVSSPNTPELRDLQKAKSLEGLLVALRLKMGELSTESENGVHKPILLKIAPDLSEQALDDVISICVDQQIDGIIATNTTIDREGLRTPEESLLRMGQGGLSGAPLREKSNHVISRIYKATGGSIPVVGVGGVFSAEDAFKKITAGASLVQGYTGFVYSGPGYAKNINRGLNALLEKGGFDGIDAAIGSAVL